ncbi:Rve domain-containing protein [Abeliophyllum distichum]|uniref:Rve domain-containing protein n=1 Tax=Abeliophyllum distichum TaxID=126358 RepID=A0ABD1UPF8_9LAMI
MRKPHGRNGSSPKGTQARVFLAYPEEGCPNARKEVRQVSALRHNSRQPHQELTTVSSPWPFAKWGLDFIGPMPRGRGNACHAIVAIDYFTKWVEAEPMMKITEANTSKFIWKNIICPVRNPQLPSL